MERAIERARARGCALVQLTGHERREDAHRFYGRPGFARGHDGVELALWPRHRPRHGGRGS